MKTDFDIAIIGSGFGGSLLAMIARRLDRSVVLLERGKHPRFAIGESSTPLANLLLEELALRYDLPRLLPLTKWGSWQKTYPEIACGLKRGFTFHHHEFGKSWQPDPEHRRQLLVAASPHDGVADSHWYRPDFDHFLVREAQSLGVEYLDETTLRAAEVFDGGIHLSGERHGTPLSLRARFVVDASGPRGFLHRALALRELPFEHLSATQALYSHFTGVTRLEEIHPSATQPPYPLDDAAVHHVFEGGWIWVLHFNNGLTSAGIAATRACADELNLAEGAPAWQRLLEKLPAVQEQFAHASPPLPFVHAPQLSFRSATSAGAHWALLPSSAGFVDPLLSSGFPLTLLGVQRLAEMFERNWGDKSFDKPLAHYSERTFTELLAVEKLVAALYRHMNDFPLFASLTLLYFAAASFSETARRLGRGELAGETFLLGEHHTFQPRFHRCLDRALRPLNTSERSDLIEDIHATIAPVDVAGLSDRSRRNWFGVEAADLLRAAPKLGATSQEIHQLLARIGMAPAPAAG